MVLRSCQDLYGRGYTMTSINAQCERDVAMQLNRMQFISNYEKGKKYRKLMCRAIPAKQLLQEIFGQFCVAQP